MEKPPPGAPGVRAARAERSARAAAHPRRRMRSGWSRAARTPREAAEAERASSHRGPAKASRWVARADVVVGSSPPPSRYLEASLEATQIVRGLRVDIAHQSSTIRFGLVSRAWCECRRACRACPCAAHFPSSHASHPHERARRTARPLASKGLAIIARLQSNAKRNEIRYECAVLERCERTIAQTKSVISSERSFSHKTAGCFLVVLVVLADD